MRHTGILHSIVYRFEVVRADDLVGRHSRLPVHLLARCPKSTVLSLQLIHCVPTLRFFRYNKFNTVPDGLTVFKRLLLDCSVVFE